MSEPYVVGMKIENSNPVKFWIWQNLLALTIVRVHPAIVMDMRRRCGPAPPSHFQRLRESEAGILGRRRVSRPARKWPVRFIRRSFVVPGIDQAEAAAIEILDVAGGHGGIGRAGDGGDLAVSLGDRATSRTAQISA